MPLKPDLRPTAHWREFSDDWLNNIYASERDKELISVGARMGWEARQKIDAEIVKNHCPSHKLIGERMAKEIMESD